ncbi:hypothetical protein MUK42_32583 [Musa troglodytarum]|uniref:Uncharacterized protein n=1 Tax=Musa troglodytarum TaxID=320322 RepID=A0A9E7F1D0_9LILI|nr:hypothetical protein MUK42_32583 [Musa troglodytarum]
MGAGDCFQLLLCIGCLCREFLCSWSRCFLDLGMLLTTDDTYESKMLEQLNEITGCV